MIIMKFKNMQCTHFSNEVIYVRHDKLTDIVTIKIFTNDPIISQQIFLLR